jgi:hypothetical protein
MRDGLRKKSGNSMASSGLVQSSIKAVYGWISNFVR